MKSIRNIAAATLMIWANAGAQGQDWNSHTRIVTASNAATNELLVYNSSDKLIQTVATGGEGGASGNAGGIAASKDLVALVNFGSKTVSIFEHSGVSKFARRRSRSCRRLRPILLFRRILQGLTQCLAHCPRASARCW